MMNPAAGLVLNSSFIIHHSSFTFMSQPEISRRCLSCGAAGRAGARFCPQCGEQVTDAGAGAAAQDAPAPETREVESPHAVAPTREVELPAAEAAREWTPPTREFAAFAQSFEGAGAGAAQTG